MRSDALFVSVETIPTLCAMLRVLHGGCVAIMMFGMQSGRSRWITAPPSILGEVSWCIYWCCVWLRHTSPYVEVCLSDQELLWLDDIQWKKMSWSQLCCCCHWRHRPSALSVINMLTLWQICFQCTFWVFTRTLVAYAKAVSCCPYQMTSDPWQRMSCFRRFLVTVEGPLHQYFL